jgi:hypothetical protein
MMAAPDNQPLAPIDAANLLAGHAVAYATAFLDGRHDAEVLSRNACALQVALMTSTDTATLILDPVRLLTVAMLRTAAVAIAPDHFGFRSARQARWQQVMAALVDLVRHESRGLLAPAPPETPGDTP